MGQSEVIATRPSAEPPKSATPEFGSAGDVERLVCAHGAMFLVTDLNGDVAPRGAREVGLFYKDTRHLSYYVLAITPGEVMHLSAESRLSAPNQIDLMVSHLERETILDDPKNFLHVRRRQLVDGDLSEEIVLTNFLRRRIEARVTFAFDADFVDIFEVRGAKRARRGKAGVPESIGADTVVLSYEGTCGTRFATTLTFTPAPAELSAHRARFDVVIEAGGSVTLEVKARPSRSRPGDEHEKERSPRPFGARADALEEDAERFRAASTRFVCDDTVVQAFLDRAANDLGALRIHFGPHAILGAGIPWFCAPFGRDALLASYEALFLNPLLAEQSLKTLAAFQGKKYDPVTEEEPGRIFHELRFGEMARAGEIPHTPYYGTIDATPLFVIVADATHRLSGNTPLLEELRPAVIAALGWIDTRSKSGTELVTYEKSTNAGLDNQGWKDSRAGVSFPDGTPADPPIALCEVQGYCYDAYRRGARILALLGDVGRADTYAARARAFRDVIDRTLWLPESERYAFAVDGSGRSLPTVVSNLGHLLWSRVPSADRAAGIAKLLLSPPSFSGFGIRTLAADQRVYNPLSYHNGTVWPHDNALIARGFANYGLADEAAKVFDATYAAMGAFRDYRLPELFCGIDRASGPLVRYPVACSPQAWSSAAIFLLIQSLLGLHADAPSATLTVRNPRLPRAIRSLELRSLRIGGALVTLRVRRVGKRCHVDRLDVTGGPLKTQIEID